MDICAHSTRAIHRYQFHISKLNMLRAQTRMKGRGILPQYNASFEVDQKQFMLFQIAWNGDSWLRNCYCSTSTCFYTFTHGTFTKRKLRLQSKAIIRFRETQTICTHNIISILTGYDVWSFSNCIQSVKWNQIPTLLNQVLITFLQ